MDKGHQIPDAEFPKPEQGGTADLNPGSIEKILSAATGVACPRCTAGREKTSRIRDIAGCGSSTPTVLDIYFDPEELTDDLVGLTIFNSGGPDGPTQLPPHVSGDGIGWIRPHRALIGTMNR
jgi:hypothetical protein